MKTIRSILEGLVCKSFTDGRKIDEYEQCNKINIDQALAEIEEVMNVTHQMTMNKYFIKLAQSDVSMMTL